VQIIKIWVKLKKNIRNFNDNEKEIRERETINYFENKLTKKKPKEENFNGLLNGINMLSYFIIGYIFSIIPNIQIKDKK